MSDLLKITLPDGSLREVAPGTTPADIAAAIGPGLAKAAIGARVNGSCSTSPARSKGMRNWRW
jgi:threonyl-tRNA synthetase